MSLTRDSHSEELTCFNAVSRAATSLGRVIVGKESAIFVDGGVSMG
jgi:hypothetical protein